MQSQMEDETKEITQDHPKNKNKDGVCTKCQWERREMISSTTTLETIFCVSGQTKLKAIGGAHL